MPQWLMLGKKTTEPTSTPLHVPAEQFFYQRRLRKHLARLPSARPLREYLTKSSGGLKQQWLGVQVIYVGLM
ncbi:hypothetical protein ACGLWX_05750 [Halomonas sp. HMF6819]|uniref:hypothetical protein n=1 Tax=Halomonas sp. HMF6819 TaxID=3373085 RepID=UPI0037AE362B